MKQMLYKAEKPQQQWNKVAWFICQSEACKRVVRYNSNNGIPEQKKQTNMLVWTSVHCCFD